MNICCHITSHFKKLLIFLMYHAQSPIIIHRHVITIKITVSKTSRLVLIKNYTFPTKEQQINKVMIVQFFGDVLFLYMVKRQVVNIFRFDAIWHINTKKAMSVYIILTCIMVEFVLINIIKTKNVPLSTDLKHFCGHTM